MDCMTPEQRHKAMVSNRSKNTSIEVKLRKALWNVGIRYRKNYKLLNYNVDIDITKYKVAIFCDGDFWHGKDFDESRFHSNKKFWSEKIKRNMERDLEATGVKPAIVKPQLNPPAPENKSMKFKPLRWFTLDQPS